MKKNGYIYYDYHRKTEKEEIIETAWTSVFHWLYAIVGTLFVLFFVFSLFFRIVEVDGNSMRPTLNDNDKLLIYSFGYTPETGDIVVVGVADETQNTLVKRVIASEGQKVDVDYNYGVVYVDGAALKEDYILSMTQQLNNEISYPYTVPKGCVFVLGDNRDDSKDSRSNEVRAVDADRIVGKAVIRLFPFDSFEIYSDGGESK